MQAGVSVIICCYNSAERLPATLQHIAMQQVPLQIKWEVIVVDNASTDNTYAVACAEWQKYRVSNSGFKVVKQPLAGLVYARQMGIETATYEYLLFCDDDNWLNPRYLTTVYEILSADTNVAALGGMGVAEPEQPALLDNDSLKHVTACGSQTWAETDHWVYGAGSAYRKSILDKLASHNWQPITTDRKGTTMSAGGDVEICLMMYLSGYKIKADDSLIFKHFVPLKRQTTTYINKLHYGLGYTNPLLYCYFYLLSNHPESFKRSVDKWLLSISKTLIKQQIYSLLHIRKVYTLQKREYLGLLGTFRSLLRNRSKMIGQYYHVKAVLAYMSNDVRDNC